MALLHLRQQGRDRVRNLCSPVPARPSAIHPVVGRTLPLCGAKPFKVGRLCDCVLHVPPALRPASPRPCPPPEARSAYGLGVPLRRGFRLAPLSRLPERVGLLAKRRPLHFRLVAAVVRVRF